VGDLKNWARAKEEAGSSGNDNQKGNGNDKGNDNGKGNGNDRAGFFGGPPQHKLCPESSASFRNTQFNQQVNRMAVLNRPPPCAHIRIQLCVHCGYRRGAIMVENKLTEVQIKNAKGKKKPYYLADGGGLNLYVTPKGTKYWRWRYRFDGKAQLYSIGEYGKVTLKDARDEH